MLTFTDRVDTRCREPQKATVACLQSTQGWPTRYIVVGTEYGYIHTTAGDVRTWGSYSGALRAAKRYETYRF